MAKRKAMSSEHGFCRVWPQASERGRRTVCFLERRTQESKNCVKNMCVVNRSKGFFVAHKRSRFPSFDLQQRMAGS